MLNALFAILLLASSVAGICAPSKFVWFSLLSYAFLPLLIINAAFILIWLFFKCREFLISAVVIAARCMVIPLVLQLGGTAEPPQSEDRADADMLKVMTFNAHGFLGRDRGAMEPSANAECFIRILMGENPDIICMQEFVDAKGSCVLDSLKILGYKNIYSLNMSDKGVPYGATIFSKIPFDYVSSVDEQRKFYVDITKDGRKLRVACMHLSSYHLGAADRVNISDTKPSDSTAAKTHSIVKKLKANVISHETEWKEDIEPMLSESPYPMLVMGDFNDTPTSYLYAKMRHRLKDTFVEKGSGIGTTYHGNFPAFRIDYIWHSPELRALAYHRVNTTISDHYPLVAVFEWKKDK